jgi:nucleotide-binding universal stress UspA family protein
MARQSLRLITGPIGGKLAVAFDGSEGSRRALHEAFLMARATNRRLSIIYVEELPRYPALSETNQEPERADAIFDQLRQEATAKGARYRVQVEAEKLVGHPAQVLVQYAKNATIDILFLGPSSHSGLWGTIADKVVCRAPCSVFVVG